MKAYNLHIENFLTIENLDVDLSPGVAGFVGKNAVGKTNILTALETILGGSNDPRLIKDGATRAEVRLEEIVDGEVVFNVSRIQTEKGTRLTGKLPAHETPKSYLSALLDDISINPIRLISDDPVTYLKNHLTTKATPEDMPAGMLDFKFDFEKNPFKQCEAQCNFYQDIRRDTYKDLRHKQELVDELKKTLPPLPEPPEIQATHYFDAKKAAEKELAQVELRNKLFDDAVDEVEARVNARELAEKELAESSVNLENVEARRPKVEVWYNEQLAELNLKRKNYLQSIDYDKERLLAVYDEKINILNTAKAEEARAKVTLGERPKVLTEHIEARIKSAEDGLKTLEEFTLINARHDQLQAKIAEHEAVKEHYDELDALYKFFAYELPKRLIERCELPVAGIEFIDGELFVNERAIKRLSSAERSIVAVKLAVAMAKTKGHIAVCLDGIENMDNEHRAEFLAAVSNTGLRVLYTRHGSPEYGHEQEVTLNN